MSNVLAAVPFVGDVLDYSSEKSQRKQNEKFNKQQREDTRYYFDQTQDRSIQRKVEDGRKAGLSALASVGAPGVTMPSIPLGRSSPDPGENFFRNVAMSIYTTQAAKQRAETENIKMQTRLMLASHLDRKNKANPHIGEKAAIKKDPATLAQTSAIEDWEPGDIQLLSDEASQSLESFTTTAATILINLGLYGGAGYEYLVKRFPNVARDWIKKATEAASKRAKRDKRAPAAKRKYRR